PRCGRRGRACPQSVAWIAKRKERVAFSLRDARRRRLRDPSPERRIPGTLVAQGGSAMSVTVAALILAQASATGTEPPRVQIHGWVDAFYGLNANRPADGTSFIPGTGTTARRANEMSLNAAAVDVSL